MTHRHFAIACVLIVAHSAVNVGLIFAGAPHLGWLGAQAILTVLTLFVICRDYAEGGAR